MKPVRLALVGFGEWGKNYVRAARATGEAYVSQVLLRGSSPRIPSAIAAGLPVSDRIEDIDADAVVIAVHPGIAAWVTTALLRARGLPVMIEKPASLSLDAANALYTAAEKAGSTLLVAHQHLFAAGFESLLDKAANLSRLQAVASFRGPKQRDYDPTWDYGPHAVSCAFALLNCASRNPWTLDPLMRAGLFEIDNDRGIVRCDVGLSPQKVASVSVGDLLYDGYAEAEPPLTRAVRAFVRAVRAGGTNDSRFGASWAIRSALILEAAAPSV